MACVPAVLKVSIVAAISWACSSPAGNVKAESQAGTGAGGTTASSVASTGGMSSGSDRAVGGNRAASGGQGTGGAGHDLGGSPTAGGAFTGGSRASGGAAATGGQSTLGGTPTTTGISGPGGVTSAGGATTDRGGSQAAGGSRVAGGAFGSGGTKVAGGSAAAGNGSMSGGAKPTGGAGVMGGTSATGGARTTSVTTKCSVYLAGDSTVSSYTLTSSTKDQAGWGQMLQQYYDTAYVTVVNKAVGGMTARHFIQAGNLAAILALLKPGDYFLVQFGTNDSNTSATYTIDGVAYPYFADANTDFKTYLQEYIDGAVAKRATPVLVTPPPRNSAYCNGGRSMSGYAQAMLDLGKAESVAVVDLSMKTWTYLSAVCPKPTDGTTEGFFKVNSDNTIDGTHFQENGARKLAGFVADGIREAGLGLDAYRLN